MTRYSPVGKVVAAVIVAGVVVVVVVIELAVYVVAEQIEELVLTSTASFITLKEGIEVMFIDCATIGALSTSILQNIMFDLLYSDHINNLGKEHGR